jgi:hypothetical protein
LGEVFEPLKPGDRSVRMWERVDWGPRPEGGREVWIFWMEWVRVCGEGRAGVEGEEERTDWIWDRAVGIENSSVFEDAIVVGIWRWSGDTRDGE